MRDIAYVIENGRKYFCESKRGIILFGYCIMKLTGVRRDCTQQQENESRFGLAKGKRFATSLGEHNSLERGNKFNRMVMYNLE